MILVIIKASAMEPPVACKKLWMRLQSLFKGLCEGYCRDSAEHHRVKKLGCLGL